MATQTPKDVLKLAKDNKVEAVDLKFLDLLGLWQHFTIPPSELTEELFEEGNGFDGSSIRSPRRTTRATRATSRARRKPTCVPRGSAM